MVKHPELFDEELLEWKSRRLLPLDKAWFHSSVTSQDSQALNNVEGLCLILAGTGMCNGGSILHHFRAGLPLQGDVIEISRARAASDALAS
jgi:metallo-beta-lactamase family protein